MNKVSLHEKDGLGVADRLLQRHGICTEHSPLSRQPDPKFGLAASERISRRAQNDANPAPQLQP